MGCSCVLLPISGLFSLCALLLDTHLVAAMFDSVAVPFSFAVEGFWFSCCCCCCDNFRHIVLMLVPVLILFILQVLSRGYCFSTSSFSVALVFACYAGSFPVVSRGFVHVQLSPARQGKGVVSDYCFILFAFWVQLICRKTRGSKEEGGWHRKARFLVVDWAIVLFSKLGCFQN